MKNIHFTALMSFCLIATQDLYGQLKTRIYPIMTDSKAVVIPAGTRAQFVQSTTTMREKRAITYTVETSALPVACTITLVAGVPHLQITNLNTAPITVGCVAEGHDYYVVHSLEREDCMLVKPSDVHITEGTIIIKVCPWNTKQID